MSKNKINLLLFLYLLFFPLIVHAELGGVIEYSLYQNQLENQRKPVSDKSAVDTAMFDAKGTFSSNIINPNIGTLSFGAGYVTLSNRNADNPVIFDLPRYYSQRTGTPSKNDNYTFNGSVNLLPQQNFPLLLYGNRSINQTDTISRFSSSEDLKKDIPVTSITTTNNQGGMWRILSSQKYPTMILSYNTGDTKNQDDLFYQRLEKRTSTRAELTKGGTKIRYRASYNREDFSEELRKNKYTSDIYSLNFEDQLSRRALMRLFTNINERDSSESINGGGNVFVRHSNILNSNYEYTLNQDTDKTTEAITYINSLHTNFRYSPDPKLDSNLNYAYSQSSGQFFSNIQSLSSGANYRLKKNLIPNASVTFVKTKNEVIENFNQNYQAGINHSHQFNLTMLNTNYSSILWLQNSDPGDATDTFTNTLSTSLSSTAFQYAQLFTSYRLTNIFFESKDGNSITFQNDFGAGANSNYIKDVTLRTAFNYSLTNIQGTYISQKGTSQYYNSDSGIDYSVFSNLLLSAGYFYNVYQSSGGDQAINKNYYYQGTLNQRITRKLNMSLVGRQTVSFFRISETKDTTGEVHLDYSIGKIFFQADYHYGTNDTFSEKITDQRYILKVSRYF